MLTHWSQFVPNIYINLTSEDIKLYIIIIIIIIIVITAPELSESFNLFIHCCTMLISRSESLSSCWRMRWIKAAVM